jgi:hypothetical protein
MRLHLPGWHRHHTAAVSPREDDAMHRVESTFSPAICRFVLSCACGERHETRYIDEALEWRELHLALAPLSDRLAAPA